MARAFFALLAVNILLVVAFILESHPPAFLGSPHRSVARHQYDIPAPPPGSCELCVLNATDPLCSYGIDSVRMSRTYEGSGYRVRRFLEKALRGEHVSVGVLGASVSMGHGINHLGRPVWQKVFFEDFQKQFPHSRLHEGLAAGTDSRRAATWCETWGS